MPSSPVTGVFNDAYVAELYESFTRDPASVDESWRQLFRLAQQLGGGAAAVSSPAPSDAGLLKTAAGAASLASAIRNYGHYAVPLDPLGTPPHPAAELAPEFHGINEGDLALVPASVLGGTTGTAADVIARLRQIYCSRIAFEIQHLQEDDEREWFRNTIEGPDFQWTIAAEERRAILARLTEVDGIERFLQRVYQGHKRFSIEGSDVLVSVLDAIIERAPAGGGREVFIAMAHRGRLNVLAHTLNKPYGWLFEEFEGANPHSGSNGSSATGDVKYHLGAIGKRTLGDGTEVTIGLVPNPSHLEFVNPALEGVVRARQRVPNDPAGGRDEASVIPVCIHGDAAFPGEGVVSETLNLSRLRGYRTGGTLHIIVNNQVGFTTDPGDARSTYYSSDLAKGFELPIVHVNGDDPEACIIAARLGVAYRQRFGRDFLIDLVSYRRHGHNETDEPAFTQPMLYAQIQRHPTPRQVWAAKLVQDGMITEAEVSAMDDKATAAFQAAYDGMKAQLAKLPPRAELPPLRASGPYMQVVEEPPVDTAVRAEVLIGLNERLLTWPTDFNPHQRLKRVLDRRRETLGENGGIEWGQAEALAFASLLTEGTPIRLTGQDAERGTFGHRNAVLHDAQRGTTYTPLQHLPQPSAPIEIYNSPLSETAVLGFDYGFSTAAPEALALWEAQYGDFVNVAQPIIDQFIVSDRAKWDQASGIVMLLPHGYEGGGPEHSSARLERFLQLCAEQNIRVANLSTPAQYFHILRRQVRSPARRPLVLMQPKSLLRLPEASSRLSDLTSGGFRPVIDDPIASANPDAVRRLVFCTGKIYYDLAKKRTGDSIALVRVEELYPWPDQEVARIVDQYTAVDEVVWAQEEPKNMGAWCVIAPWLRASTGNALAVRYIGRPERASPAEGYAKTHEMEQQRVVEAVLRDVPLRATARKRSTAARP